MRIPESINSFAVAPNAGTSSSIAAIQGTEHPFLIVDKGQYPQLRARAGRTPWKDMKATALLVARNATDDPRADIRRRTTALARSFSLTALAYILDPDHRSMYRDTITTLTEAFNSTAPGNITGLMRDNPDKMIWTHAVPTGNAYFQAVLALDVVHDDLEPAVLARLEAILRDGPAQYFAETALAWHQGSWAAKVIWPLYERDAAQFGPIVQAWHAHVLESISTDGVFTGGTGYATARWTNPDREHKAILGDILAHTGILPGWYDQPQLRNFMQWLNGYSHTPFRVAWTFGDGAPSSYSKDHPTGTERSYRYGELAGRYAGWLNQGAIPNAFLSTYVLTDTFPLTPAAAPSRVFPDGGAWLKETSLDPLALAGALYNLRAVTDDHAHKETNSLALAAYGELLLRGGGYNGWATGDKGFSWNYIHHRAVAGNVAFFNYPLPTGPAEEFDPSTVNDHVQAAGAGITTSMLTGRVDSATGDSGDAIPNGHQLRTFLFIQPADDAPGYFATVDELTSTEPDATGQVVWHPGSAAVAETRDGTEFTWNVHEFSREGVRLTLFLGTPPTKTALHNGVLANWNELGVVAKYLSANYPTGDGGRKSVVTVLFPHDAHHAKATFTRLCVEGLTGATIALGEITDYLYESSGSADVTPEHGVIVQARAGYHRRSGDGTLGGIWLKDATRFSTACTGFQSTTPVTLYQQNRAVRLESAGNVDVTFHRPGLTEIRLNDSATGVLDPDTESIRMSLPAGTHIIELVTRD